eukprot:g4225.t1
MSTTGERLVSSAERAGFVEEVLAGKLEPDFSAVAYHFEGWLDKEVVDAIFEVSSGPTEAVSALAGMFPPEPAPADGSSGSTSGEEGADRPSTTTTQLAAAAAAAEAVLLANSRHARTLEDIQAQRRPPSPPTATAPATATAAEEDEAEPPSPPTAAAPATGTTAEEADAESPSTPTAAAPATATAAEEYEAEPHEAEDAGPEAEVAPAAGGVDVAVSSSSSSNAELEKVAAFIASYAGEQEAASMAPLTPTKPPETPFLVPRGISVPSTRKVQLAIAETAEKAVELPGFEAFMKIQHGKDSLFRFLSAEHALHSYYLVAKKHVQETVVKGGKARGATEPRKDPPPPPPANNKTEDPDVAEIMRMLGGVGP